MSRISVLSWSSPVRSYSREASQSASRSEEHTSELQSPCNLVCRLLLEKNNAIECIWAAFFPQGLLHKAENAFDLVTQLKNNTDDNHGNDNQDSAVRHNDTARMSNALDAV